jgi:hypothetical protein
MKSSKGGVVLRVARWVVAHRGRVAIGWSQCSCSR